jgi:hypothetical protein
MKISFQPRLQRASPLYVGGDYAIEVVIGSIHVFGRGVDSGAAICDLVKSTLGCAEMISREPGNSLHVVSAADDAKKLVRGIVQAALELACLRHELCLPDCPPMVVEECSKIVDDTFNAMHGVDTCDPKPCDEVAEFYRVLGVQP